MADDNRERSRSRPHSVVLDNRSHLTIEGVQHVENFDDDAIVLSTDMGLLMVKGHHLKILQLDLDAGHFAAEGEMDSLTYTRKRGPKPEGAWARLWR
jgi:sporulation protein YabP